MSTPTNVGAAEASINDDVTVRPLTGSIGVTLSGIDLTKEISEHDASQLRSALHENCVLVIRGQSLDHDDHMRLANVFGEPFFPHYYAANAVEGYPQIAIVPNFGKARAPAEGWHTDWSHMTTPPTVSVSIGTVIPEAGGDTMFSNQYAAYDRLSDAMKELLDGRRARFAGSRPVGAVEKLEGTPDHLPKGKKEPVVNHHLIAQVHPDTGRTALYLNRPGAAMEAIEGLTDEESFPILEFLYNQSATPDNVYRHQWAPGDIVCWDNRCAMHYGVHDYGDVERTLLRITVGGAL